MSALHALSVAVCLLIGYGLYRRRDRVAHRKIMYAAFAIDLGMVLWIEFTRAAIEQSLALGPRPMPGPLLMFHIIASTVVLVLYVAQLILGAKLFSGRNDLRKWHLYCGSAFVILRFTNLVTSFMIVP